ncbi:MAG: hypothetical protein SPG48_13515 [Treponema sp.]|nr:hypothetical protein [Treponema sp.]
MSNLPISKINQKNITFFNFLQERIKKDKISGQISSFEFLFLGWLFASQKKREMHSISRPEFALQTRAFQGSSAKAPPFLRGLKQSFTPLRNWLRQPLQSLPRFLIKYSKLNLSVQTPHTDDFLVVQER